MGNTFASGMFGTRIPENWEASPMNDTDIYNKAPVSKWHREEVITAKINSYLEHLTEE